MSITILAWLVGVIDGFLVWAGLPVGDDEIGTFVKVSLALISAVGIYFGRYRKGDITWFGKRKPK